MVNILKQTLLVNFVPPLVNLLGYKVPPLPSVCGIIEKGDKILAINLSYKKGYSLPGGGVNPGETLEEGLIREIKEETNLDVKKLTYLFSNFSLEGKFGMVSACFKVDIQDFKKMNASEEGEIMWLKPKKILKNCAYKDVEKHIKQYFNL